MSVFTHYRFIKYHESKEMMCMYSQFLISFKYNIIQKDIRKKKYDRMVSEEKIFCWISSLPGKQ